jgi:hypothetical protein
MGKNSQKFAFFSKNVQKCALFDPVFCTPLRKLFEVKNSYFVSRISYVARGNSATDSAVAQGYGGQVHRFF